MSTIQRMKFNQKFIKFLCFFFSLAIIHVEGNAQNLKQFNTSKRARDNFDSFWQFHKGDIAIKRAVKAGGYGGLTDVNVKVETNKEVVVAYTDVAKAAIFKSANVKLFPTKYCLLFNSFSSKTVFCIICNLQDSK